MAATAEAGLALLEHATSAAPLWVGANILPNGTSTSLDGRPQGTLGHPLPLSFVLAIGFTILVCRRGVVPQALRVPLAALLLAGQAASGTVSSLLFCAAILLLFSGRGGTLLRAVGGAGVAVVVFLALFGGFFQDTTVASFTASGSVTHRLGALQAANKLSEGPAINTILGNGAASEPRLFAEGQLQTDGLQAVDNQFVTTFAEAGLVGTILLIGLMAVSILAARDEVLACLLVCLAEFAIFDVLAWPSTLALVVTFVGVASRATFTESPRPVPTPRARARALVAH